MENNSESSLAEQARKEFVENPLKIIIPFTGDAKVHQVMKQDMEEAKRDGDYFGAASAYLTEKMFYLVKYGLIGSGIVRIGYGIKSLENLF